MIENFESASELEGGMCRANGVDLHYRRTGGSKPPLIALHGLIGSGACLYPLARTLKRDFDVILPDARGHGFSSAPANGYLYDDLAKDVLGLIGELRLNRSILLGHSMGGMTAAVAARHLGPSIEALILVDPTFISPEWQQEVYESDLVSDHRQLLASAKEELVAQAARKNPARSAEMIHHLVDARFRTSEAAFEVLTPPNPDFRDLIRNIHVPILLVVGTRGVVSHTDALELQDLNPSLRYERIPGATHGLPYDEPAQLGATISTFLKQAMG